MIFPNEIWEKILDDLDPVSLLKFTRVCQTWRSIILHILKKTDKWYNKCCKDVPENMWSSILENQDEDEINYQDFHEAKQHAELWMKLYRSWIKWNRLAKKESIRNEFEPFALQRPSEIITSIATKKNIIAVGSSEGCIKFYDICKVNDEPLFVKDQCESVEDIQLYGSGENMYAAARDSNKCVKYWKLCSSNVNPRTSHADFIRASFEIVCTIVEERTSNDICYKIKVEKLLQNGEIAVLLDDGVHFSSEVFAVGADGYKLTLWTRECCHLELDTNEDTERIMWSPDEPPITVRNYLIMRPYIIGIIGDSGTFGLSVYERDFKIYESFGIFQACVSTVLFHVAILVLGFDSGDVRIFHIEDVNSLWNMDFKTMVGQRLTVDCEAIISLNVTECQSRQYIIAATRKKVHVLEYS